jgi:hypothetical protein
MIRTKKIAVLANSSTGLTVSGNYVACISISNPLAEISFSAFDIKGAAISEVFFKEGVKLRLNDQYTQVSFVNKSDEDLVIVVVLGSGSYDSDRVAGEVAITGNQTVQKIIEPVDTNIKYFEPYKNQSYSYEVYRTENNHPTKPFLPSSSKGYSEMLSPSDNINGVIIRNALLQNYYNSKSQYLNIVLSTSRPSIVPTNINNVENTKLLITTGFMTTVTRIQNIIIPAGIGVYVGIYTTDWYDTFMSIDIDYEVL